MIVRKATPKSMTSAATSRPVRFVGTSSPYPTVVTVWTAHQSPDPIDGKFSPSTRVIRSPAPTVITVDAVAITMVAPRGVVARATALSSRRSSLDSSATLSGFAFAGSSPAIPGGQPTGQVVCTAPHTRPPVARAILTLYPRDQGPDLHAHRGDRRCAHDIASRDAGRRAQLGLPVHLDAGLDLYAPGASTSWTSIGRRRSSCSSSRTWRRMRTADCRSCTGSTAGATSPSRRGTTSPGAMQAPARSCIGNGAFDQRQNDVYGAVLDSILLHTRRSQRLPRRLWPIVQSQAECATRVWHEPDQGIWEARGKPPARASSKLMCWVALDRASKLAAIRGDDETEEGVAQARLTRSRPRRSRARRHRRRVLCNTTTQRRSMPPPS